jgi:asparagine synthase (glutamine-hydrolysing)
MTSIAAIGTASDRRQLRESCAALVAGMSHRGAERQALDHGERFALGVSRFAWECDSALQGEAVVVRQHGYAVVADATLYYQADLRRALESRGERSDWTHAAELILAAYRAFGDECLSVLEGDYAFVIWEDKRNRLVMGRDHAGRRPLHYWANGDHVMVASTARSLASHVAVRARINEAAVVAAIGALFGGSLESGFVDVFPVPASTLLAWEPRRGVREVGRWSPPAFPSAGSADLVEGGRELRRLLGIAAAERISGRADAAIWLSGGADSPAVLGAFSCTEAYRTTRVHPITLSYPVGDTAREDDYVHAIAEALDLHVTWQDSETIDLLGDWDRRSAERDDPYAHTFEGVNRRLAQRSRETGARVVLDGYGGDQLFSVSDVFLADLLIRGRWSELATARGAMKLSGFRSLVRTSLLPLLPEHWRFVLSRARGYRADDIRWQTLPNWVTPEWKADARIVSRYEKEPVRRLLEAPSAYESRWYVETPYFPRAVSWTTTFGLSEGIDLRSPLFDPRVIRFAATRPLAERGSAGPSKPLLRQAMQGVLPASFLAPRPTKTGIPGDYLIRNLRAALPNLMPFIGPPVTWNLTHGGFIDPHRLTKAVNTLDGSHNHQLLVQLFLSVQAELWMRSVASQ